MIAPAGRSRLALLAAGFLALVAIASLLILDLGGGRVTASDLPAVQIGQLPGSDPSTGASEAADGATTAGSGSGAPATTDLTDGTPVSAGASPAGNKPSGAGGGSASTANTHGSASVSTTQSVSPTDGSGQDPAESSTTTTHRETVTGGVRVHNGPGAGDGTMEGAGQGPGSGQGMTPSTEAAGGHR